MNKIDNYVGTCLSVIGLAISLDSVYTILGIVLLICNIILIIARIVLQVVDRVKADDTKGAVNALKHGQDDLEKIGKQIKEDKKDGQD